MRHVTRNTSIPGLALGLRLCGPVFSGAVASQGRTQRQQPQLGITDHRQRLVLGRIMAARVQADQAGIGRKHRPASGGEVLQPRADGQDHVRRPRDGIGTVGSGDPQRSDVQGVIRQQVRPPGNGFHHRNAMRLGKTRKFRHRARVLHPTPGHDHRAFGGAQQGRSLSHFGTVGRLAADAVDAPREERLGVVIGPALQVLRQTHEGRAAIGGVKHRGKGCRQRLQDLRGVSDAVPVAADRLEGVVQSQRGVPEMLQLLQHRVGQPGQERITAEHQHRQSVGMGKGGCRQQVCGARSRTRGAEHEPAAQMVLGVSRRRKAHALFVLPPIERHLLMHRIKRFTQTRHVAMAKNAEAAAANPDLFAVNQDILVHQPADDGLCHGQPEGGSGHASGHGSSKRHRP